MRSRTTLCEAKLLLIRQWTLDNVLNAMCFLIKCVIKEFVRYILESSWRRYAYIFFFIFSPRIIVEFIYFYENIYFIFINILTTFCGFISANSIIYITYYKYPKRISPTNLYVSHSSHWRFVKINNIVLQIVVPLLII